MADYALIKMIDSVETIDNVIVADATFAATQLVANGGDYDYVRDVSLYDPSPGRGWTYDPGMDEFSPPPEDFEAELEMALMNVDTALEQAVLAYQDASPTQQSTAIANILSSLSDGDQDEYEFMITVTDYVSGV